VTAGRDVDRDQTDVGVVRERPHGSAIDFGVEEGLARHVERVAGCGIGGQDLGEFFGRFGAELFDRDFGAIERIREQRAISAGLHRDRDIARTVSRGALQQQRGFE